MWNQEYMRKKYNVDALFDANKLNGFVENGGFLVITGLPMDPESGLALVQKKLLFGSSESTVEKLMLNNWSIQNLKMKPVYSNGFARNVYQYKTDPSVMSLGKTADILSNTARVVSLSCRSSLSVAHHWKKRKAMPHS